MEFVYSCPGASTGKLKAALDADSLAKDSFATAGYTLKESAGIGLPAGKYFVHFSTDDAALASRLKERLALVPECVAASESEAKRVCEVVAEEASAAASGFGSIFG